MSGWRKRQINDSQMPRLPDTSRDDSELISTHAGSWPHEALSMLRLSSPAQAWQPLLHHQPVVDVLRGGTGRRDDRSTGAGGSESMGHTRREGETK